MSDKNIGRTEQGRWLKDYNIRIIPISDEKNYQDVDIFLRILLDDEKKAV
jgi:hypothetical protein